MKPPVSIIEVGPRDGLQNEQVTLTPAERAELIVELAGSGLRRIEAVSFVNEIRVPTMAGAEAVLAAAEPRLPPGTSLSCLVLNARGVDRALSSNCAEANAVIVATETFNRRNQGVGRAETLAVWGQQVSRFRAAGIPAALTIGAAFGCPFEGVVTQDEVLALARAGFNQGFTEIVLADTIGCAVPTQVTALFSAVAEACPNAVLRAHFHDTRATGLANVMAALAVGVTRFDASVAGFGGCPFAPAATGNIATEDLVHMLERCGYPTGVNLSGVIATGRRLAHRLGRQAPGAVSRAGPFPAATITKPEVIA